MIILGVICLIFAAVSIQAMAWNDLALGGVVLWAAIGSVLIARGISKNKQKQSQQQTVIVNNYITQVPDPQQKKDDVQ